ncbi:MAG: GNAT family N-acetyltransferase, partial [Pseudomonadota bacterium]
RGQGLAGRVLKHAEVSCRAKGLCDIFLEVAEDNHAARALYIRLGYEPIGRRPAYYKTKSGRIAAITYRRVLDETS